MQSSIIPAAGSSAPFNPLPVSAQEPNQTDFTNDEEDFSHPGSEASSPRVPPDNSRRHLYRGHRSGSLIVEDLDELTEWRARQRTFDGAYVRTALGTSFFALTITKIFRKDMSQIGLEFGILALLILSISYIRRRRLNHDFADKHFPQPVSSQPYGAAPPRIWGREYRTPGDAVLVMVAAVAAIQIHLIVLFSSMD